MLDTEFLSAEELAEMSGYVLPRSQRQWLKDNGWNFVVNASGKPIVGRLYARLKLAGIDPEAVLSPSKPAPAAASWSPDFSALS